MSDVTDAQLDGYFASVIAKIAEHGWMVQGVFPSDLNSGVVPFAYTVGLTLMGLPELFIMGLPAVLGQQILNETAQQMVDKAEAAPDDAPALTDPLPDGTIVDLDFSVQFRVRADVDPRQAESFLALRIAEADGATLRLTQILWPDTEGRFPDQDGYDAEQFPQQVIDKA